MSQKEESECEAIADALLASPVAAGVRRKIRATEAAVRERRLTPAAGLMRASRVTVAAQLLLAGRGPGASS